MTQTVRGGTKVAQTVRDVLEEGTARFVAPMVKAAEALELMREENLHHLVVLSGKTVLGIVSLKDLSEATLGLKPVGAFVTQRPPVATPSMQLADAVELMRGRTVGCLPVMDRLKLVGVITLSGTLRALGDTVRR